MSGKRRAGEGRLAAEEQRLRRRVAELAAIAAECAQLKAALRESQDRYDRLQNLVENAMKFLGDQTDPRITIGAEEREVRCWVADNGIGVDPSYHDRIFGLFEKLVPQVEG